MSFAIATATVTATATATASASATVKMTCTRDILVLLVILEELQNNCSSAKPLNNTH